MEFSRKRVLLLSLAIVALFCHSTFGRLPFIDNFEEGMDKWEKISGAAIPLEIYGPDSSKNISPRPCSEYEGYSAFQPAYVGGGNGCAFFHNFGKYSGYIIAEVYLYDDFLFNTEGDHVYGGITLSTTNNEGQPDYADYFHIGIFQYSGTSLFYSTRTKADGISTTSVPRKKGWTKLTIEADSGIGGEVRFYIDNILAAVSVRTADSLSAIILGRNFSNNENFWYDGVRVATTPADCPLANLAGECIVNMEDFSVMAHCWMNSLSLVGDLTDDYQVDLKDFQALSECWLINDCNDCIGVDINGDSNIDLDDLLMMSENWLKKIKYECVLSDITKDKVVDLQDLLILASQWLTDSVLSEPDITWVYIEDPGVTDHEEFIGYMSKYETTNLQFAQFLNDALKTGDIIISGNYVRGFDGSNPGEDFDGEIYYFMGGTGYTFDNATLGGKARISFNGFDFSVACGFENHPVSYVSWYGATAFCNYYGWRLPTEWEWQAVADYDGSYEYACGTAINNSFANYYGSEHPHGTTAVGNYGSFGYGMADMAGNVWEWTSSLVAPESTYRCFRGGGWSNYSWYCYVNNRGGSGYSVNGTYHFIGFRVCR